MRLRYLALVLFVVGSVPIGVLPVVLARITPWITVPFGIVAGSATSAMLYVAWRVDRERLEKAGNRW